MLVCMGVGRKFSRGDHWWIFPKVFLRGPKVVKLGFYHSELREQHFLLKFVNSYPSSDINMFVYGTSMHRNIDAISYFQHSHNVIHSFRSSTT